MAVVSALAIIGCGDNENGTEEPAKTEQRIYNPVDQGGEPSSNLQLTEERGSCFAGSGIAFRSDAWRCVPAGSSELQDPCFATSSNAVVCVMTPWDTEATSLNLTKPLPVESQAGGEQTDRPWALELVDGRRCTLLGGATRAIANRRVNFGCDDGSYLLGDPDESAPVWTIFAGEGDQQSIEAVQIKIAWL